MKTLEIMNLKKALNGKPIIKDISFSLEEGEILGFLGPNGAGKTTTIRMITGLINIDSGDIRIFGHNIATEREKALTELGAVVETPEMYLYMPGYENLMQIARIRNIPDKRIEEIIELIGLKDRIHEKVKRYSLGMKQRLGLGMALLSNPKLLILDEPTNGLDPTGIIELREMLKTLAKKEKISILVSSHILSEVQELCDRVVFIKSGVIVDEKNVQEENDNLFDSYEVKLIEDFDLVKLLEKEEFVQLVKKEQDSYTVEIDKDKSPLLLKIFVDNNVKVKEFKLKLKGLEQTYKELLMDGGR